MKIYQAQHVQLVACTPMYWTMQFYNISLLLVKIQGQALVTFHVYPLPLWKHLRGRSSILLLFFFIPPKGSLR